MYPESNQTTPLQTIGVAVSTKETEDQGKIPLVEENSTDLSFLGLTQTLQSTLDIRKLLELYDDEVSAFLPHDGFRYQNQREDIQLEFGDTDSHSYTYKLILLRKNLGEVSFFRKQPFTKSELDQLDKLVAALLYPVRNSLLYKRAVETAYRDPLTDLHNRAAMENAFDQELDFANRHGLPMTVLMVDLDKFKQVNDQYSHIAGDTVLKSVADKMRENVRRSDVIFRFGGEEFLIMLRNTDVAGASLIANRIRVAIENMVCYHQEQEIRVTTSIGLSKLQPDDTKYSLLERVDKALYKAKDQGRNQVIIAD